MRYGVEVNSRRFVGKAFSGKGKQVLSVAKRSRVMRSLHTMLCAMVIASAMVLDANAGSRLIQQVEVNKGKKTKEFVQIITLDGERARIDFAKADGQVHDETPYIMTLDEGDSWVMGDKPEDEFYCTETQTDEFFKMVGQRVASAIDFYNVRVEEAPTVRKLLEEPGPEILGFKTTRVRLETRAKAHAWLLLVKIEYEVRIVEDLWYTTDTGIHPIREKWLNAITQTGNDLIDQYTDAYIAKLPGPVLKTEMTMDIADLRKQKVKTRKERTIYTQVEEVPSEALDEVFAMPQCAPMSEDEVEERAKELFSSGRIML